jgi:hypothetical protein
MKGVWIFKSILVLKWKALKKKDINQGVQDFESISWTPQETHPRDYRLGFGNQHQPPGCSTDI